MNIFDSARSKTLSWRVVDVSGCVNYILLSGSNNSRRIMCIWTAHSQRLLLRVYFLDLHSTCMNIYFMLAHKRVLKRFWARFVCMIASSATASIASISYAVCICFLLTWHIVNDLHCIIDKMGEEYNTGRAAWLPTFLVVVSVYWMYFMLANVYKCHLICVIETCLVLRRYTLSQGQVLLLNNV